ncbi:MAG: hypothetical protein CVU66_00470 [Deltaproteobacteria bacterium HGW-Deltaproteobacteria-23]|nr:MAG: hypothetical protein CVU66_00470 [Deltaproteobacteria bacterium HGW-Deltaproteobacteria-23]
MHLEVTKRMSRKYSIRSSLLVTVSTLTLLPLMVAVIISLVMFHNETTARIRTENLKVAQTVASAVELFSARPVVMLKQIREEVNEDYGSDVTKIPRIANDTLDTDPLFESVKFVNSRGELVAIAGDSLATNAKQTFQQNFSDSVLFKAVRKTGQVAWSEPFVSLRSGESVISVALPWQDGMISGTMNLSNIIKLVEPTKTSQNAYAFIVSPEGRLIAHPDRALVGEKEAFISIPQITAGFQGEVGTYHFKISDREVIGSVLPFAQNGWVIVAVHDKEKAYASLYRMETILGLFIVFVLSVALVYSIRRVGQIVAPVLALSEFTRRVAMGQQQSEPFEPSDYIEIQDLYENFQTMEGAVAARESELKERNAELSIIEEELKHQVDEYLQANAALSLEKAKLDSVLASMGEGLSIQSLDYKVLLQNQAHRELVGDAVGRYCYDVYSHNDKVCSDCPLKVAFEDGAIHTKLHHIKRDEGDIYLEVSASPLRDSFGKITGGIEVVRDVTSRFLAGQEIRRLNQELETRVIERTAELETVNRELESFSYSVSHDLRAPLRHISSFSSILESDYADKLDKEGKYYIARIIAGCNKMGDLIDDLLELAQISRGQLRTAPVNLSRIANAIAASLAEREPERQVSFKIEDGLIADGDERLLDVMMNNLLGNAWKYTGQKDGAIIEFGCKTIDGKPVFFIKDNGSGFDKNYADKLFTPFHRLHGTEYEGTGVGLAIVQRIIHRHNGKIWAEAVVGEGAIFYFSL